MRARITVSTTWTTNRPGDKETIEMLANYPNPEVCLDYLMDSNKDQDDELSIPEAKVEILEE